MKKAAKKNYRADEGKKRGDTRLYSIWENMKSRCYNKNVPKYETYGKKGVRVCKEWKDSYDDFHDWAISHGYNSSLSLDRIDPDGNYEPSNCRWANNTEQANNKTNSRKDGVKQERAHRLDSLKMDQTYYTDEGYLVDHPVVTRCGIFEYSDPDSEDGIRRELRLPEEVFSEESLASYEGKPIIITHDAGEIDKDNVHEEQIGTILSKGYRDGNKVRCKIVIHNTDALKQCGLRELSLGYALNLDRTPGVYHGQAYDGIQRDIEVNHLALVGEARAGDRARLNIDHKDTRTKKYLKGGPMMLGTRKGTRMVQSRKRHDSGLSPEELEQAIALFKAQRDSSAMNEEEEVKMDAEDVINGVRERKDRRDSDEEQMDAEEIIAEQEGDIEALLEVIDELQAASDMSAADGDGSAENEDDDPDESSDGDDPDGNSDEDDINEDEDDEDGPVNMDSVDKLVGKKLRDYLDVCRVADRLNLDGVENLTLVNARKRVIAAVNPKLRLDGKSDAYISAAYDIAKQSVAGRKRVDDQRRRIMSGKNFDSMDTGAKSSAAAAREKMIAKRENRKNGGED